MEQKNQHHIRNSGVISGYHLNLMSKVSRLIIILDTTMHRNTAKIVLLVWQIHDLRANLGFQDMVLSAELSLMSSDDNQITSLF